MSIIHMEQLTLLFLMLLLPIIAIALAAQHMGLTDAFQKHIATCL